MGLDSYLYREKDIESLEDSISYKGKSGKTEKAKLSYSGFGYHEGYIKTQVAYWRKANMIHRYFVETVQNGEDDCGYYYVSREALEELLRRCKAIHNSCKLVLDPDVDNHLVIEDPSVAVRLLPTQAGFFFGSTSYDQDYMYDIDKTIEMLNEILEKDKDDDFVEYFYTSSW